GTQSESTGGPCTKEATGLMQRNVLAFAPIVISLINLAGRLAHAHCKAAAYARVAELADAYGSGPYGETRGGSSPLASSNSPPSGGLLGSGLPSGSPTSFH